MRVAIRTGRQSEPAPVERLTPPPSRVSISLDPAITRSVLVPTVHAGSHVTAGDVVARGEACQMHASLGGRVCAVSPSAIDIDRDADQPDPVFPPIRPPCRSEWPAFAAEMGLVGMGGSHFPASRKLAAATRIHTLIINAVECEPGIEIDEALLLHAPASVEAGIDLLTQSLEIPTRILALKKSARHRLAHTLSRLHLRLLPMPDRYPAGAERLIVEQAAGRRPPVGCLPVHLGYLVLSVASLWAIGRRIREGRPSIDRPLTLRVPGQPARNLIVPVGTPVETLLSRAGIATPPPDGLVAVAGGLMMGRRVPFHASIHKGVNALFLLEPSNRLKQPEEPCILCGACVDICPLDLHPAGMASRWRDGCRSSALEAHLDACFLCGACSAVCPASIPLVRLFEEGKAWLAKRR